MKQVVFRARHPLAAIVACALAIVCMPEMAQAQVELEGVTILSTRSERNVYDIPANVTVIDRDELDKENVKDIDQLVRNVPGVIVSRQTSATDPFNTFGGFTIRGVGANRVQISVDGSRIAESIQDGTRDYISLDLVKSVDIVRGPASVLWGSDALGGLVAFETLDPEDILAPGSLMNGELKTSYDSENDAWKKTAIVAGSISPHAQFLAAYSTITANEVERSKARADGGIWGCPRNIDYGATPCNQLNPTDILSNNFLGKIVATPAPGHRVELTADILDRKIEVDQRHDLGPEFSTITGLPTGVVNEDFQRVLDLQRQRYAVEHKWDVGNELFENIKWVLSISPQDYSREGRRVRTLANGNRVVIEDALDFSEQFTEADIQFVSPFMLAGLRHRFTYGFDGDITRTNYERRDVTTNLTTGTVTEARAGGFNFANAETTRADLFIQDEIKLFDNRLELIPGVRYATYKIVPNPNEDYQVVPGAEPKTVESEALTAKIGATYDLANHYAVYGQFAQGFKMPTAQQLYTSLPGDAFNLLPAPDLQPEKVNSYELGLRGKFDLSKFSVNVFYADYSDFIQSFFNLPGTDDFTYRNLSSVQLYGIEASGQTEIMPNLVAYGSLSYQFGNQTVEPGADEEAFNAAAPFNGIAGLIYKIPGYNLEFDFSSIFAADVTRQNSPTLFRPEGYVVFDLNTLWRPWHNIEITGSVLNILDQRYFKGPLPYSFETDPSDSGARSNPLELQTQPGRTLRVGVTAKF